jgi:thymidylate synthase (FAD)
MNPISIKPYDSIQVSLLNATPNPQELISRAAMITMKKNYSDTSDNVQGLIHFLVKANHTSLLEHIVYSFEIKGASRSFLSQITRHRIASFTSGSQHYQDYTGYGFNVPGRYSQEPIFQEAYSSSMDFYKRLLEKGIPKEEARQVLPNGIENNLMMTINARSLLNFFNLRMCKRNVEEMQVIAGKMHCLVQPHFPELWDLAGPPCYMNHKCNQGKMSCRNPYTRINQGITE